jgi:hypothetical protein
MLLGSVGSLVKDNKFYHSFPEYYVISMFLQITTKNNINQKCFIFTVVLMTRLAAHAIGTPEVYSVFGSLLHASIIEILYLALLLIVI